MIRIKNLSKEYENRKGVQDISFEIQDGEVFGLMGPDGAGKTTLTRILMGFVKPDGGRSAINGRDCWKRADENYLSLGYLPGKDALPENMTAMQFVHFLASMRNIRNLERAFELMSQFEIEEGWKIGEMSVEERQRLSIVAAFLHNPRMYILDEPTKGLEPLMKNRFIELVLEEKEKGKTIVLTSAAYEEVERTCDRVGMIYEGSLQSILDVEAMRASKRKDYMIQFENEQAVIRFMLEPFEVKKVKDNQITVNMKGEIAPLIQALSNYQVTSLESFTQSLEEVFPHVYGGSLHA